MIEQRKSLQFSWKILYKIYSAFYQNTNLKGYDSIFALTIVNNSLIHAISNMVIKENLWGKLK
jgi:uncharacterized membrane protein